MANTPTDSTNTIGEYTFADGHIVCKFPINDARISAKGKSMLLVSTRGAETFTYDGMDVKFNVNIYVPIEQWKKAKAKKSK